MANLRTVKPKTTRIISPLQFVRDFGIDAWIPLSRIRPAEGAFVVLFLINGTWVMKGWLMPQIVNGVMRGK